MSKKHSLRRSAAGILAVLTVTGNLLAPAQFGITPIAQNAIVAEAATINQSGRWNYSGIAWDASTGTLTIKNGITNKEGAVNHDVDDEITGNLYCSFTKKIQYSAVKNIVFADGMTLPKSCQQLLKNFVNLETFRIEGEIDASNVYNLESMFEGLDKLTSVSFTGLKNTGMIDYIDNMFAGCEQLKVIDLSMLGGENVGMRDWGDGHGGYHPAVDHIRRAVAGCTALEDLNLTGEFLYNLWENIKEKQGIDSIDRILNEMLADLDSPHKQEIFDRLKQRFQDYKDAIEDEMQWKPVTWNWTETEDGYTCTVDVQKKVKKANGHGFEYKTETGKVCEISSSVATVPTCERAGVRTFIAKWTNTETEPAVTYTCEDESHVKPEAAYGHAYQGASCEWAADHSSADFVEECSRCDAVRRTPAAVTSEHTAATCTADAYTVYKADANGLHDEVTVTEENSAFGHDFAAFVGFEWSEDFTSAKAVLKCSRCDETDKVNAAVTVETSEGTCTEAGQTVYTATYDGHTESKTVTGETFGGHDFAEFVGFEWSEDFTSAKAVLKCSRCDATDKVNAAVTSETREATCTAAGETVYTAVYDGHTESKTVAGAEATGHSYGAPFWRWADDYSSAELVFACENEGCNEETALEAEVVLDVNDIRYIEANDVRGGKDVFKATVTVDGQTFTDEKLVDTEKLSEVITAATRTLQLEGRIIVNWYARFCADITAPQMLIVDEAGDVLETVEGTYMSNGQYAGRYLFSFDVAAKEMSDETYVKFIGVRDGETVSTVKSYGYSVRDYCENKLGDEATQAELKDLCAAILTYGAAAQQYFEYRTEDLADMNLNELWGEEYAVDKSVIENSEAQGRREKFDDAAVSIKSPSLLLESGTTVRFYSNFTAADDLSDKFLAYRLVGTDEFAYAPIKTVTTEKGTFYVGEIENIAAKNLTNFYEVYFCVKNEDGTSTQLSDTLFYGPECYAVSKYNNAESTDELKELVAAMMDYCQKAKTFFGSRNG